MSRQLDGGASFAGLGSSGFQLREALLGAGSDTLLQLDSGGVSKDILTGDTIIHINYEEAFLLFSEKGEWRV